MQPSNRKSDSMDIMLADKNKKYIRAAIWMLRKKIGDSATAPAVHDDLKHSGNPVIYLLSQILTYAGNQIKEPYQSKVVRELGEFFLWIMYRDSGYRDVFFWILDQLLQRADEVRQYIKPYVKEPKDWNVNIWHDTKANTKKLQKEKRIPPYQKAFDENIFVPSEQRKKLKKIK